MRIIGFNHGPGDLIPHPEGAMHLFLTAYLKEVWKAMRRALAAGMGKASEWVEREFRDSLSGARTRRTARRSGFIGPVIAVCLPGPLLAGFLMNRHGHAPVAGALGYRPPGLQTTMGLVYGGPVVLGGNWYLPKTARLPAAGRDRPPGANLAPDRCAPCSSAAGRVSTPGCCCRRRSSCSG